MGSAMKKMDDIFAQDIPWLERAGFFMSLKEDMEKEAFPRQAVMPLSTAGGAAALGLLGYKSNVSRSERKGFSDAEREAINQLRTHQEGIDPQTYKPDFLDRLKSKYLHSKLEGTRIAKSNPMATAAVHAISGGIAGAMVGKALLRALPKVAAELPLPGKKKKKKKDKLSKSDGKMIDETAKKIPAFAKKQEPPPKAMVTSQPPPAPPQIFPGPAATPPGGAPMGMTPAGPPMGGPPPGGMPMASPDEVADAMGGGPPGGISPSPMGMPAPSPDLAGSGKTFVQKLFPDGVIAYIPLTSPDTAEVEAPSMGTPTMGAEPPPMAMGPKTSSIKLASLVTGSGMRKIARSQFSEVTDSEFQRMCYAIDLPYGDVEKTASTNQMDRSYLLQNIMEADIENGFDKTAGLWGGVVNIGRRIFNPAGMAKKQRMTELAAKFRGEAVPRVAKELSSAEKGLAATQARQGIGTTNPVQRLIGPDTRNLSFLKGRDASQVIRDAPTTRIQRGLERAKTRQAQVQRGIEGKAKAQAAAPPQSRVVRQAPTQAAPAAPQAAPVAQAAPQAAQVPSPMSNMASGLFGGNVPTGNMPQMVQKMFPDGIPRWVPVAGVGAASLGAGYMAGR